MPFDGVRVLVTGASGFLGSHATRALVAKGAEVHALIRADAWLDRIESVKHELQIHQGDITDYEGIVSCIRAAEPKVIVHLAGDVGARRSLGSWETFSRNVEVNFLGTLNLIRAVSETGSAVDSMVRVGGLEEYGTSPIPFLESAREQPVSPYAAAQVAATHLCQALQPDLRFSVVTLRPALVYGPGQSKEFFIPQLIDACLSGRDFDMTDGTQSRDLVFVDDVVEGILLAAGSAAQLRGAVINLASGTEHTVSSIADLIVQLTGARISIRRGARQSSSGELHHLVGSAELARSLLGWQARTPLEDGLAQTIRSFASRS